jgi:hypothetical protein
MLAGPLRIGLGARTGGGGSLGRRPRPCGAQAPAGARSPDRDCRPRAAPSGGRGVPLTTPPPARNRAREAPARLLRRRDRRRDPQARAGPGQRGGGRCRVTARDRRGEAGTGEADHRPCARPGQGLRWELPQGKARGPQDAEPSVLPDDPCSGRCDRRLRVRGAVRLPAWFTKELDGSPNGIRTRVSTLRGWCPRPLDDGTAGPRRAGLVEAGKECSSAGWGSGAGARASGLGRRGSGVGAGIGGPRAVPGSRALTR